jgi:protein CMS1
MSSEDDLQEPLVERLSASPDPKSTKTPSKKRKRGSAEDAGKKTKSKKAKAVEEDELDTEAGINRAFAHMDNQLLADYVAQRTRKYESELSMIELEDKYIPGSTSVHFGHSNTDSTRSKCYSRHNLVG